MKKKLFVCCTMAMAATLLMPTMTSCESFPPSGRAATGTACW